MNQRYVLFNLKEASEELIDTIKEIETAEPGSFDEKTLRSALAHAYHHLNFAWNARDITHEQAEHLTDAQFDEWRRFPSGGLSGFEQSEEETESVSQGERE